MTRRLLGAAIVLLVFAPACGSEEADPRVLRAGQVDIRLPDGWTVNEASAVKPAASSNGDGPTGGSGQAGNASAATTTPPETVPLSQDDPQTAFFKAVRVFQQCLADNGTTFIGVPDPSNPNSPTNDPDYLSVLGTCAAKSNILQALQDVQAAQDAMTPAEIEESNEQYLDWRDCMIGRGWGMPEPKPDEKGRLFSFGGTSGPPDFDPPPGEDPLTSGDFQECIEEVS